MFNKKYECEEVRIMTSKSEEQAIKGNYHGAAYESLKESGLIGRISRDSRSKLVRPAKVNLTSS